ncbi:MAG: heavy-metal-associated domain-containing protein [Ottowia sp.]|nr:heavy-metal-associated domain-containing protein [Ottowia sp.]
MLEFHVPDMTCGGCVAAITKALQAIDPNVAVETDLARHQLRVQTTASSETVRATLVDAGFSPEQAAS